jgi:hypothetical protein
MLRNPKRAAAHRLSSAAEAAEGRDKRRFAAAHGRPYGNEKPDATKTAPSSVP